MALFGGGILSRITSKLPVGGGKLMSAIGGGTPTEAPTGGFLSKLLPPMSLSGLWSKHKDTLILISVILTLIILKPWRWLKTKKRR